MVKYSFAKTFHGPELAQDNWSDFILLSISTSFKPPCFYAAINVECSVLGFYHSKGTVFALMLTDQR